jgi:hypothetical protein
MRGERDDTDHRVRLIRARSDYNDTHGEARTLSTHVTCTAF